ncbi:NADP-dependent oxidoreductase [Acetobacter okinawensis]|uniref:NADP-dependent oxidoreductase n=1 Tax=Acetobacter okinawensis TaxID=1076594 RepID=UPI001BAAF4EA|nr:NADP-dependent oxidoreductase [Acetobacter okinawensis]MBS0989294.1 NADP-dependent oxidoreductase [Acetobacter okinawensis]
MKAFVLERYAKKNPLRLTDIPEPTPGDWDVLIEVHAAGVNRLDSKIRDGEFKLILPYKPPIVLGHDVAGVVRSVGQRVKKFKPGDEVYGRPRDGRIGTFAEYIAVNETDLAFKPKNLTMEEAASIPLVGLTAWQALIERAGLSKGQRVLIHAGSGGVGTFAIQLANHLGCTVATTTGASNIALVKSLGATFVIDYKSDDFENCLSGYDVVLNSLGSDILTKSLGVLRTGGTLISISGPPDVAFAREQGLNFILRQVLRVLSVGIRKQAKAHDITYSFLFMHASGSQLQKITSLLESGVIKPVVDRMFSFEDINEALSHIETGRAKGKIVIKIL